MKPLRQDMTKMEWTDEAHDLQYLGKDRPYVSVRRFPTGAELAEWYLGCSFSPKLTWHESVDAAKQAGELVMRISK